MNYKKTTLIILSFLVVVGLGVLVAKQKGVQNQLPATIVQEPQRTDFGTKMPADFPTDIPVEEGAKVEQSYSLNYVGQKQLTIVFPSTKTVKENYVLYTDFLKKQNWVISNKYENESGKLSSLYGTKESNDINVTLSENATSASAKSYVSISVLKK